METEARNFTIAVQELILTEGGKGAGTETFVYEPSNIEEEALGNLYIIGWLRNRRHDLEFLPNLIASVIRREFYTRDERSTEAHFESALKKANAALLDINTTNKNVIRDIHLCAVNIAGNKIRLCIYGDILALLCRNNEVVDIKQRARRREGKNELFSSIITGDIMQGDTILLSTKTVFDLFSDNGIKKLLSLSLEEQGDIITKIYQKNAKEALLPDQAAILMRVKDIAQTAMTFPEKKIQKDKPYAASSAARKQRVFSLFAAAVKKTLSAKTSFLRRVRTLPALSVRKKNAYIFSGIFISIIVFGGAYALIHAKIVALRSLERRIAAARAMTDTARAAEELRSITRDALAFMPSLFTASAAQRVFQEANKDLNARYGIRITPPARIAQFRINSIIFSPSYVFDDDAFIYIFSDTPDTVLTIAKATKEQRFMFLASENADFATERMMQKDNVFYFINDTKKTALRWRPSDANVVGVKRPPGKSAQTVRETPHGNYMLKNNIIIHTATSGESVRYLVGNIIPITDFTIAKANPALYILTRDAVFSLPL